MEPMAREAPDRYDPLPSLPEIPAWLWHRTSRAARVVRALSAPAILAAGVALAPRIGDSNREAQERTQRERARQRAELARTLQAEQRPILRRFAVARPDTLAARGRMMDGITSAIATDARARVRRGALKGPIRRVSCERFPSRPGAAGADRDLSQRRGRFSCIAVTAEFQGGVLGHQYRVAADFTTGRYAFCKITGLAGPEREQIVTIPAACGGEHYRER
jgi:hypothetical protein